MSSLLTPGEDNRIAGCRASPILGRHDEVVILCTQSHEKAEGARRVKTEVGAICTGMTFRWNTRRSSATEERGPTVRPAPLM